MQRELLFFPHPCPLCYHLQVRSVAMAERRIDVQVFPAFRREVSVSWLRRVAQQALSQGTSAVSEEASNENPSYSLSLVIADDETVRRLNHDYRGLDETTDVLAFAVGHPGHSEGEGTSPSPTSQEAFITSPEEACYTGEVIVSYPQCLRQAAAQGHASRDELTLLITHGVLHLLGYDHATPQEEEAMKAMERRALGAAGTHS